MPNITRNLEIVSERILAAAQAAGREPGSIRLLAVSKTKPASLIRAAYTAGQRAFGENYLQDALPKIAELSDLNIEWHFIGQIQSNKTRDIAQYFAWVHGIDRLKLAQRLNDQRSPDLPPLQCCIQVNLSGESSKGGIDPSNLVELAQAIQVMPNLRLRGLMTLPNPHSAQAQQAADFAALADWRNRLVDAGLPLDTLSMGMSGDLELAIQNGSTMVRVGTDIFGPREYAATDGGPG